MDGSDVIVSDETLIWSNTNDSRNHAIIEKENRDIENFVPKTIAEKSVECEVCEEIDYEAEFKAILSKDYETLNFLEIIKDQLKIVSYLTNCFKNIPSDKLSWTDFKPGLTWILNSSSFITTSLNIRVNQAQVDKVHRSSYSFCTHNEACIATHGEIFSNASKNKHCNGEHFVHHKIIQDLTSLITVFNNVGIIYDDLRLGLSTLDYVIRHMFNELKAFSIIRGNRSTLFNINDDYKVSLKQEKKHNNKTNEKNSYRNNPFGGLSEC